MNVKSSHIQKLYIAYFGRPADPSGINYWLINSPPGTTINDISEIISTQDEYTESILSDRSIESQINYIHMNLFGRKVDFDCINNWHSSIDQGKSIISDFVCELISCDRNIKNNDQLRKDYITLESKVNAAELFTKKVSSSISWINLYQPESLDPWKTGKALNAGFVFLRQFNHEKIASIDHVMDTLKSITLDSIEILKDPVIQLKDVSLKIPIYCAENRKFTKILTEKMFNSVIGGELVYKDKRTNIEALKNINLTIMNGERVALIGHNGSGKSSFLRLISGIYTPNSGQFIKKIEVYPMLQKTFLTSNELSGLDASKAYYLMINNNLKGFDIFLEDIVTFSGLGSFINLPIKTYSEGMCARLIFSMLTSYPHECLAIDEGFGTGDADFFERAQERMQSFMDSATTLILASHSEQLLKQFCFRGIVFNHGSVVYDGQLDAALNYYHTHDYNNNYAS
ncbi:ABC transporter ATP-binding protein [Prochlorococcus sp. MIT 0801]|uniref:ABC transporter ATP-binding protein n=1 Tax=Prochlorococcus sp. MIT 0801 TaxID=1501269 RepID=UPI0004F7DAD1|nr:ATP-binding cassette domain-containing protein [Prochlorococcus sp. MIT 0801]AIQ98257.1 putative ABC-type polysaccharide/polyol phosphate transport system ATPase component [Prochlorococcus sp. MIT 0801]